MDSLRCSTDLRGPFGARGQLAARFQALGITIRAGVHTGEVEFVGDNVRGLAVHETARVAGVAAAGEVLVSATTKHLLEGSGIALESAGVHELKGLGEARELFRITGSE